ncbi:DUF257 family protein [Thermococcus barophilus]|uniref:KaiC-like domain-containing protein n=1 Tax=Thermococcus barophilus (strain DSM 11836 / MP) TaxID=391623 RepID=F0LLM9_THEBM|nr:DUF257 family protein [Thermococcus barophilus]ADT83806.1 hypothetical protein TERMP_00829 [Thermococcus barophilus MP]
MVEKVSYLMEHFSKIKPGEIVLIEYTPDSFYPIAFYVLATYSLKLGLPLLIDDILDTLHLYKTYLDFAGLNTDFLYSEDVFVLKIGGHKEVGNVVSEIRLTGEFYIQYENYKAAFDSILSQRDFFINIVLGFDRLTDLYPSYQRYLFLLTRTHYLGNKRRTAFYFVNRELLKKTPLVLPIFEEISTSVVRLEKEGNTILVTFLKSPYPSLVGSQFKFSIEEMLNYLKEGL